mmetsp:Transcript_90109/g.291204  ORF Transcript_90109/g.291204 Transcript_90109/m.291204 type:complete len:375 (-) Transcript_90109:821-1945(-)
MVPAAAQAADLRQLLQCTGFQNGCRRRAESVAAFIGLAPREDLAMDESTCAVLAAAEPGSVFDVGQRAQGLHGHAEEPEANLSITIEATAVGTPLVRCYKSAFRGSENAGNRTFDTVEVHSLWMQQTLLFRLRHLSLRNLEDECRSSGGDFLLHLLHLHVHRVLLDAGRIPNADHALAPDLEPSALHLLQAGGNSTFNLHLFLTEAAASSGAQPKLTRSVGAPCKDMALCERHRVVGATGDLRAALQNDGRLCALLGHRVLLALVGDSNVTVRVLVSAPQPHSAQSIQGTCVVVTTRYLADEHTSRQRHKAGFAIVVGTRGASQCTTVVASPREQPAIRCHAYHVQGSHSDVEDAFGREVFYDGRFFPLPLIVP